MVVMVVAEVVANLVDEMGEVVAGGVEVLVFMLLLCPGCCQEEPSKARTSRYYPTFQMKKLKPKKEIALSFHTRKTLPLCLLPVPNSQKPGI